MADAESRNNPLVTVADEVEDAARQDRVSVGDVVDAIGKRAFAPLLLVFSLISMSPVGSIPGASISLATLMILVAGQAMLGRGSLWFPGWILRLRVKAERARSSMDWAKPYLQRVDGFLKPRWQMLLRPPAPRLVSMICILLALTMYPLALIPWGVVAPSLAILFLSLGLLSRDGLVVAAGLAITLVAIGVSGYLLATSGLLI